MIWLHWWGNRFPKEITQVVRIARAGLGRVGTEKGEEGSPFVRMAKRGDQLAVDVVAEEGWAVVVE